jgi:hypothetical protein
VLPEPVLDGVRGGVAVPITAPRLVHRTEILHGGLTGGPAEILAVLTGASPS